MSREAANGSVKAEIAATGSWRHSDAASAFSPSWTRIVGVTMSSPSNALAPQTKTYVVKPKREWVPGGEPTGTGQELAPVMAELAIKHGLLGKRANDKGNVYRTTGRVNFTPQRFDFVDEDGVKKSALLGGSFTITINQIRDAAAAEAATVENARAALSRLTPEQRKAELERLMAEDE